LPRESRGGTIPWARRMELRCSGGLEERSENAEF
jgi:hypothetical protein